MTQPTHSGGVWAWGEPGEPERHPPLPTRRLRRRKPLPPQLVSSTPFAAAVETTTSTSASASWYQRGGNDTDGSPWSISPAALAESSAGGSGGSTGRLSRSSKRRSTALYYWGEAGSSMKVQVRTATKQLCKKSLSTDGTPTEDASANKKKKEKKRRKLKHSSSRGGEEEEEMVTKKKTEKKKTKKEKKAKKDEAKATGKESGAEETSSRVSSKKEKRDKEGKKEAKKKEKKEKKKGTRVARAASEGSESGISSGSSAVSPKETTKKKKKKKKSNSLISAKKKVLKSRSPSDPLPAADGKARSFILNFHHHRQPKRGPPAPAPSSGPTRSRSATETIEYRATRKSSIVGLLRRTATTDGDSEEPAAASPFFIEEDGCGGLPVVAGDESGARVAIPHLALDALTGAVGPSSSEAPDSATSLPPSPSLPSPGGSLASVVATAATKTKSKRVKAWCKKKGLVDKRRRSGGGLEQYQQLVMTMGVLDGDAGSSTPLRHVIVEGRYAVGLP